MFLPTFIYLLLARFMPELSWCPESMVHWASLTPEWATSTASLVFFGVMATIEFIANHNDSMRELLEGKYDTYIKALYSLLMVIFAGAQTPEPATTTIVAKQAGIGSGTALGLLGASVTWGICTFRQKILRAIRLTDDDNSLRLHTLAAYFEELLWVILLLVMILAPIVALALTILGFVMAAVYSRWLKQHEVKVSHACPHCQTLVPNSAEICHHCHQEQANVCEVGWLSPSSNVTFKGEDIASHRMQLLRKHHCPRCAKSLGSGSVCPSCGQNIWETGVTRDDFVRRCDLMALSVFVASLLLCSIPVIGYILSIVSFNLMAVRPLFAFFSGVKRMSMRFFKRFLRWLAIVLGGILSAVPFGGVIPMAIYVIYYLSIRRKFKKLSWV